MEQLWEYQDINFVLFLFLIVSSVINLVNFIPASISSRCVFLRQKSRLNFEIVECKPD